MRKLVFIYILVFISCNDKSEISSVDPINWDKRYIALNDADSLLYKGSSYLSVYSSVYSISDKKIHNLTVTVSLRNTSDADSLFVSKADYYDTEGKLVRDYFTKPIFILPMETVEIVIDEKDTHGGTGGNFIFNWSSYKQDAKPLFEAVMISTSGQQGLSFATQAIRIK